MSIRVIVFTISALATSFVGCASPQKTVTGKNCVSEMDRFGEQLMKDRSGSKMLDATPATMAKIATPIEAKSTLFKACYEKHVGRVGKEQGTIRSAFIIGEDGTVLKACITETTFAEFEFQSCVLEILKATVFPKLGGVARVTYPFKFQVTN